MAGRKLDIPRIKRVVMLLSGIVLGALSGLTGISAQVAASPYTTFMLGYAAPKAARAAFLMAFWAGIAAVVTWTIVEGASPPLLFCLLAAVGATVGTLLAAPLGPTGLPGQSGRIGRAMLVIALVYVVSEGVRSRFGGPRGLTEDWLRGAAGWLITGGCSGFVARALGVPTGVLMVPSLAFIAGVDPSVALVSSLAVSVLAGIAPAIGYAVRSEGDALLGPSMTIGGVIGGALGGWLLAEVADSRSAWPLVSFGVTAMVLCSWLAYRSADT